MTDDTRVTRALADGMDAEADACATILASCFGMDDEQAAGWVARAGLPDVRALSDGDDLVACLNLFDFGHWFGGRSVSSGAISAVGVALHARGRGAARRLMTDVLVELAERRVALSTLYPASWPLYRSLGYELAGIRARIAVPTSRLPRARAERVVRPMTDDDAPAVERCQRAWARPRDAALDRAPGNWLRARMPRGKPARGCVFESRELPGELDAYVLWTTSESKADHLMYDLQLTDVAVRDARAVPDVLAFLASTSTLADRVVTHGGLDHPFLPALPDRFYDLSLGDVWMLRIVDVDRAFTQRAYPRPVDLRVHLDVRDALLPGNAGRRVVTIRDGAASVEPGGDGALSLDVRALAALYTGHLRPDALVGLGLAEPCEDLQRLADALAVRSPSLVEMF